MKQHENGKMRPWAWWLLGAFLGAFSLVIPRFIPFMMSSLTIFLVQVGWLLVVGIVMGFLNPERPWRWGLSTVVLFPLIEVILIFFQPTVLSGPMPFFQIIPYVLIMIPIYALYALPGLFGAYMGSTLKKRHFHKPYARAWFARSQYAMLAFLLGIFAGSLPLFFTDRGPLILSFWFVGLFLAGIAMGLIRPERVWRWAIVMDLSLAIVVIGRIIIDVTRYGQPHQFFPLEIWFALLYGALPSFAGVYLGYWIRRYADHHAHPTHKGIPHAG